MTTTLTAGSAASTASGWSDDVLRRVVKAWTAAYGLSHETFAAGIGMNPRTFARRLAGQGRRQAFTAGEVADMAAFMSEHTGEKVSVAEMYAGRVTVFVNSGQPGTPADGEGARDTRSAFDPTNPCLSDRRVILGPWPSLVREAVRVSTAA